MDTLTELAKMFKERNNPSVQAICVGKVLSGLPDIRISVNGFILDKSRLVVGKHLTAGYITDNASVGDHGSHSHGVSDMLKTGERVIVLPGENDAVYFVLDKVGEI